MKPRVIPADELFRTVLKGRWLPISIRHRRPQDARAVLPYLAMSYLYKRSNLFWHFLIRHNLTHAVWSPLVELTRRRHLGFRRRLALTAAPSLIRTATSGAVVSAGV